MLVLLAACSGANGSSDDEPAADEPAATSAADDRASGVDADSDLPAIEPGGVASGRVEIDGTVVDYVTVTPEGFEPGAEAPLLLALPPGGQDLGLTRSIVERTYATEAARRGWVVVSPAAPNGELYFQGSEVLLPPLVDWIESWVMLEGGAPHVAGISNGGISSFRYAAENPDRVRSIVVFPGFPQSEADREALEELTGVPIRLFVGENDSGWLEAAEEAAATLQGLGGDAELAIVPGEGHILAATADGTAVFDLLDSFR